MLAAAIIGLSEIIESCAPVTQPEDVAPITGKSSDRSITVAWGGNLVNVVSIGITMGSIRPIVAHAEPIIAAITVVLIKQITGKYAMLTIDEKKDEQCKRLFANLVLKWCLRSRH